MDQPNADDARPDTDESARSDSHDTVDHHDRERALHHKLDRIAPSRHAIWPKDDRRSSTRVPRPEAEPPAG